MYWESHSESALIASMTVLCIIIVCNVVNKLGRFLPYRVNCWFCNGNTWIPFPRRNCWTCPKCEQYNGFTKDGDYNRPLPPASETVFTTPHRKLRSLPAGNGLCRMCNINQQLKIAQLANFVPISEAGFDREIDNYKLQLEKAYKLCSRCRKVLKLKLHKEKESLLGSKLMENRSPKKDAHREKHNKTVKKFIKYSAMAVTLSLIVLITFDCYNYTLQYKSIKTTIVRCTQMASSIFDRLMIIGRAKAMQTFPFLHNYEDITISKYIDYNELNKIILKWIPKIDMDFSNTSKMQQILGGAGCMINIFCHFLNRNVVRYQTVTDMLWTALLLSLITRSVYVPILLFLKISAATTLFIIYRNIGVKARMSIYASLAVNSKRMKNLIQGNNDSCSKNSDSDLETDDDVSLSQYGIDNSTFSNDTKSPFDFSFSPTLNSSFTKKPASLWSVPAHNKSFDCSSSLLNSSISQAGYKTQQIVLAKPEFNSYQKMDINESESDLDEGINGLHLGSSPKKSIPNNIFSLNKFQSLHRFTVPSLSHQRQLISPSKLGQGTSWVAGGYWGDDSSRGLFDVAASRSSSQSSGFESQASSFQRNIFSQPPSRAESACSELDRTSIFSDPPPQQFGAVPNMFHPQACRLRSPVHPQMRYDSHIHIPLPLGHHKMQNPFSTYNDASSTSSNMFPPIKRVSGLIKLPHI